MGRAYGCEPDRSRFPAKTVERLIAVDRLESISIDHPTTGSTDRLRTVSGFSTVSSETESQWVQFDSRYQSCVAAFGEDLRHGSYARKLRFQFAFSSPVPAVSISG